MVITSVPYLGLTYVGNVGRYDTVYAYFPKQFYHACLPNTYLLQE